MTAPPSHPAMSARREALEAAIRALDEVAAPADIIEFGVRHKLREFAGATYMAGVADARRAIRVLIEEEG